jgi:biopolymer transport protein ExbB/TolQ
MWGELAYSFQHANGYVIAIMALGFIAVVVFFERLIMLQFVYNIDFGKFLGNLKKMVAAEDLDRAITLCKNVSRTSLPHISARALEAAETDPTTIRGTIEEETISFLPQIEKRLGVMPAFTILIMLIGILGTIDSLWLAFHSVDVLDTARKQASLAQGIASSLNPSAMALIFGMSLLAGHQMLKGVAINLIERVHHGVAVLSNLLVPQDMVAYAPAMMDAGGGGGGGGGGSAMAAAPAAGGETNEFVTADSKKGEAANDAFDDVSVEDIKDEEEII